MAIPLHIRRKIAKFDPVRDGKTVKQFCREENVSKQTYYNIKKRVKEQGVSGVIAGSTAPKNPRRVYGSDIRNSVFQARSLLKTEGRDNGPISIYYYLIDELGMQHPPSRSTIASWLGEAGLADANARKRPRKTYKRFARSRVNELWQIDGLVYFLFDEETTKVTIYQLIDDASRFDVGTQAFTGRENGTHARATLEKAMRTYGRPIEVLSDNGEAFSGYHRGHLTETEKWLASQGVWAIAGYAPTTQGKDERSHKTLRQYLDVRQPATLEELRSLIEEFRDFYNTRRRHQSLIVDKINITPQQAWDNFVHAPSPTTPIDPERLWAKIVNTYQRVQDNEEKHSASEVVAATSETQHDGAPIQEDPYPFAVPTVTDDLVISHNSWGIPDRLKIGEGGIVKILGYRLYIGTRYRHRILCSNVTDNLAEFFTEYNGELLFSILLPIQLDGREKGRIDININCVIGMWHRHPPKFKPPKRQKHKTKKSPESH